MARHWQKNDPRFSVLFDEYPDLPGAPYVCYGCKGTKKTSMAQTNSVVFLVSLIKKTDLLNNPLLLTKKVLLLLMEARQVLCLCIKVYI